MVQLTTPAGGHMDSAGLKGAMQMFTQSSYNGIDRDNTAYRWNAEQPDMVLTLLRSFNLQSSAAFADHYHLARRVRSW